MQGKLHEDIEVLRQGTIYYLSFLVWPFGVLLDALKHYDKPWFKNVLWLFCIFFGFTFIIAEGEGGADSDRYASWFIQYAHSEYNMAELWRSFYSAGSNMLDIASPLIMFIVSRVTDDPKILFTVFGLIFGFFYSRNICYILSKVKGNITPLIFVFILTFILINPIWNINGFRMWTAAQLFLFGSLPYFIDGNGKRLIWSFIAVFFHFSFLFPVTILLLFILMGNKLNIYFFFFLITSMVKEIDLQMVRSVLSFLPAFFQPKILAYTNTEYAEATTIGYQMINWYVPYSRKAIGWVIYIMAFFIYFTCKKLLSSRKDMMTLLCFSLLLYGCANLFSLVPSGGRYLDVASSFVFAFFIVFISTYHKTIEMVFIKTLCVPLLLLFLIVSIRMGMDYFGLVTIIGNPLAALLNSESIPLIAEIKSLLQ